ncbi:hypothetical protein ACOI4A_13235 [Escherichia coli]
MAKSLFRALVALSFLAPLWLNAAPRVITLSPANTELAFAAGITLGWGQQLFRLSSTSAKD